MLHYVRSAGRRLPWEEHSYPYSMEPEPLRFSVEASVPIALLLGAMMVGLDWARRNE